MPTYTTKRHVVDVQQGAGSAWIVKVFRKRPLLRKLVSSDWFLDGQQAQRFVKELLPALDGDEALLSTRRPGWVLRRPPR